MKKNVSIIILLLVVSMFGVTLTGKNTTAVDVTNISISNDQPELNSRALSAQELFKLEPTNPTQILKQLWREKSAQKEFLSPTTVQPKTLKDNLYDEVDFWIIESFSTYPYNYITVTATLLALGANSYVYVTNSIIQAYGQTYAQNLAEEWRDEFENKIYPNDVMYFGNPNGTLGDIDGDPHVTILLCELDGGVAGYFDPINEYVTQYSNQREMVYVDYQMPYGVLAHEFQHLIHFNYDQNELTFVDEGCAELAQYLNGYVTSDNLTSFARDYFAYHPEDSLLYWNYYSEENLDVRIDYGGAYMFIFYLAEKYGAPMIRDLVANTLTGARGIEDALANAGYPISFNELYLNWITALTIDEPTIGDGLYGFVNIDISMFKDLCTIFPTERTYLHRYYGFHILNLQGSPDYLRVDVQQPLNYWVGVSVAVLDENGWHITKEILTDENTFFINGTNIEEAYMITALMDESTPYVASGSDFGVGYTEDVTFTIVIGKPLYIDNYNLNYDSTTWWLSINDVIITDENNTEITDEMGFNVYLKLIGLTTPDTVLTYNLSYSTTYHWNIELNLSFLDEASYDLTIIAEGNQYWGQKDIGTIKVEHIITVTKPEVNVIDETSVEVKVNASYTQLNGYEKFINGANVKASVYNKADDEIVTIKTLYYDPALKLWTGVIDLAEYGTGDYYIIIKFNYNGRVVNSEPSAVFHIEGTETTDTNTNILGFNATVLIGTIALGFITLSLVLRNKRK